MKTRLTLLLLTISVSVFGQTSVYHPFPDSNATWCAEICGNQGNDLNEATYQLNGQVLINGNLYNRMLHYERSCYGVGTCYCGSINGIDTTTYYVWQDTTQKKVWLYYPSTNSDTIFLDFDLHVGDTIDARKAYWARQFQSGDVIVSFIDSVLVGSQYRTRYNYTYQTFVNSMIEGIGPTHGFFYDANKGYDYLTTLNMFSQNNQIFYPFYSSDTSGMGQHCHDFALNNEEIFAGSSSKIFPNPFHQTATLDLNNIFEGELKIYNTFGQQVRRQKINSQTITINRDGLGDGLYFFQVTNDNGTLTSGKLMIE